MGKCDLEGITAISERNKILPEIGDRKRSRTHYCHMWLPMDNDLFRTNPSLGKATPKRPDLLFGFGCEIQMNDVVHARACDVERPGSGRPGLRCTIANRSAIPAWPAAGMLGVQLLSCCHKFLWSLKGITKLLAVKQHPMDTGELRSQLPPNLQPRVIEQTLLQIRDRSVSVTVKELRVMLVVII